MSIHWMNRVWDESAMKGSYLLALLAIADNANDYGIAWPGHLSIARRTRLTPRTSQRVVEHISKAGEIVYRVGGSGPKDTNVYAILIGRDPAEVTQIVRLFHNKGVKLSTLKGCQIGYLDKLSTTKRLNKGDIAVSPEPSGTNGNTNEWMDDPIGRFLLVLPGFNPSMVEATRGAIVDRNYDVRELPYLWSECTSADNPIGLFTHKVQSSQHAAAWIEEQRRQEEHAVFLAQAEAAEARRRAAAAGSSEPWPEVPEPLILIWEGARGELALEMTKAAYDTWVKGCRLYKVEGDVWTFAAPDRLAQEWLSQRLSTTIRRVLSGWCGHAVTIEIMVQHGAQ